MTSWLVAETHPHTFIAGEHNSVLVFTAKGAKKLVAHAAAESSPRHHSYKKELHLHPRLDAAAHYLQ